MVIVPIDVEYPFLPIICVSTLILSSILTILFGTHCSKLNTLCCTSSKRTYPASGNESLVLIFSVSFLNTFLSNNTGSNGF